MFDVVLQRQAEKYYARCDRDMAKRLAAVFVLLENDPFDQSTKALTGKLHGTRRARVGGLRVVYEVDTPQKLVRVLAILPRGDVYKK
jgi:mRNA interferase RelE/StbE